MLGGDLATLEQARPLVTPPLSHGVPHLPPLATLEQLAFFLGGTALLPGAAASPTQGHTHGTC